MSGFMLSPLLLHKLIKKRKGAKREVGKRKKEGKRATWRGGSILQRVLLSLFSAQVNFKNEGSRKGGKERERKGGKRRRSSVPQRVLTSLPRECVS